MTDDLNVRACKALGCKLIKSNGEDVAVRINEDMARLLGREGCKHSFIKYLKFKTSYDWCMLLVKRCDLMQREKICDILFFSYKIHFMDATPAQIAQAAVEVLTLKKSNKNSSLLDNNFIDYGCQLCTGSFKDEKLTQGFHNIGCPNKDGAKLRSIFSDVDK